MKIRTDFVTNSSSSSFCVTLCLEDENGKSVKIAKQTTFIGDEYETVNFFCGKSIWLYDEEIDFDGYKLEEYEEDCEEVECNETEIDDEDYDDGYKLEEYEEDCEEVECNETEIDDEDYDDGCEYVSRVIDPVKNTLDVNKIMAVIKEYRLNGEDSLSENKKNLLIDIRKYCKKKNMDIDSVIKCVVRGTNSARGEQFEMITNLLDELVFDELTEDCDFEKYAKKYNTDVESLKVLLSHVNNEIGMATLCKKYEHYILREKVKKSYKLLESDTDEIKGF